MAIEHTAPDQRLVWWFICLLLDRDPDLGYDPEFLWSTLRLSVDRSLPHSKHVRFAPLTDMDDFVVPVSPSRAEDLARSVEDALRDAIDQEIRCAVSPRDLNWLPPYLRVVASRYLWLWELHQLQLPLAADMRSDVAGLRFALASAIAEIRKANPALIRHLTTITYAESHVLVRDMTMRDYDAYSSVPSNNDGRGDDLGAVDVREEFEEHDGAPTQGSVLELLELMEDALPLENAFRRPPGPPPRHDLTYLSAALADIWSQCAGRPFPRHTPVVGANFKRGHASFVLSGLRCFDSTVTFENALTAMKTMLKLTKDPT